MPPRQTDHPEPPFEGDIRRERLDEPDSIPVTPEQLRLMGLKPPPEYRERIPGEVPPGRFAGRLTFDFTPLKGLLDRMKAEGRYPVSMRLVPREKPSNGSEILASSPFE